MKRILSLGLTIVLCACILVGCASKLNGDRSTVYVEKKGTVLSLDVEALDKDYYDEDELTSYIHDNLDSYIEEHGKTVTMEDFSVKDSVARLSMKYDSYEDYSNFNGIELYVGTVVQAQAEGFDFDTDFVSVEKGTIADSVKRADVIAQDDNKVVIIKKNVDVKVAGTIIYVSSDNVEVTSKNTVSIQTKDANDEAELTYIIYK